MAKRGPSMLLVETLERKIRKRLEVEEDPKEIDKLLLTGVRLANGLLWAARPSKAEGERQVKKSAKDMEQPIEATEDNDDDLAFDDWPDEEETDE